MLFDNKRKLSITVPAKGKDGSNTTIADLVRHLCDNVMKDPRKELFILDGTV
jgi:ubiquitin related modifier 1